MPTCPKCRRHFRVMEDEDDGQHGCPYCGYGAEADVICIYCTAIILEEEYDEKVFPYCSAQCSINAQLEEEEGVA